MEEKSMFEAKVQLLFSLIGNGYLKDKRLFKAFLGETIENYIPEEYIYHAGFYNDRPSLFYHQNVNNYRTISAPHMISIMLQGLLLSKTDEDLLILGAKSGFIAALAHKLSPDGTITILEANSEIAKITKENLKKLDHQENINVLIRNPLEGVPESMPWKKILVTGAIKQEKMYHLLEQLDPDNGVLFAPIGGDKTQTYTQILRINDEYFGRKQLQVQFSPLMTQIEVDFEELELITDFEEISEDEEVSPIENKNQHVTIKYTSSILDEVDLKPNAKLEVPTLHIKPKDIGKIFLNFIDETATYILDEQDFSLFTNFIDKINTLINILENFKGKLRINFKKIKSSFNQIKAYSILRGELALDVENGPNAEMLEKMADIIKKQFEEINKFQEVTKSELKKLE